MKRQWRALSGVLVALAAHGCAQAQLLPLAPEELYERLAPSVWLVEVPRTDGKVSLGSAVVVAPHTLVTNCHVIEKAREITVGHWDRRLPARLQYRDPTRDLCQLQAPGLFAPAVRLAGVDSLRVGATVYALGNPRGLELTLSDGLVSALRRNRSGEVEYLQISVPISPGSSGGGLFDVHGRLVGITTSGFKESQNLNFALPADFVVALPARAGGTVVTRLDPPLAPPPRPLPPIAVAPLPAPAPAPAPQPESVPAPTVVPVPAPSAPSVRPVATPGLAAGQVFEYQLRDRLTGISRRVSYRLDRIDGDHLVFNNGSRVEKSGGEVLSVGAAIAGEYEQAMPPGGWASAVRPDAGAWRGEYAAAGDGRPYLMDLQVKARGEGLVRIAGREMRTVLIQFRGYTTRGGGITTNPSGRYVASVWFAPELGRVVRFEARTRGGLGHTAFMVDEVLELVEIRRE